MVNLIPPQALKKVKREYWIRVVSVWVWLAASACVIVVILNIPVYVLVQSQLEAFASQYEQASVESESFEDAQEAIKQSNEIATLLAGPRKTASFSSIIAKLESLHGGDVSITEFSLTQKTAKLEPITIKGVAASRAALTSFKDAIEEHPEFMNVVLPLANLARDRDIPFSITVSQEVAEE